MANSINHAGSGAQATIRITPLGKKLFLSYLIMASEFQKVIFLEF